MLKFGLDSDAKQFEYRNTAIRHILEICTEELFQNFLRGKKVVQIVKCSEKQP